MRATLLILGLLFANLSLAQEKWEYCKFEHLIVNKTATKNYLIQFPNNVFVLWITVKGVHRLDTTRAVKDLKEAGIDIDIKNTRKLSNFPVINALGQARWELVSTQSKSIEDSLGMTYWFKRKSK